MSQKLIFGFCTILHWTYKHTISPLLGPRCRFSPACSDYALEAVKQFGLLKGGAMAFKRLLCCHPWHPGGEDPVPKNFNLFKNSPY